MARAGPLFDVSGLGVFGAIGFDPFQGLAAGTSIAPLALSFDGTGLGVGLFEGTIVLIAGSRMGNELFDLAPVALTLRARIVDGGQVPEPGSLLLVAGGLLMIVAAGVAARRRMA